PGISSPPAPAGSSAPKPPASSLRIVASSIGSGVVSGMPESISGVVSGYGAGSGVVSTPAITTGGSLVAVSTGWLSRSSFGPTSGTLLSLVPPSSAPTSPTSALISIG